MQLLVYGYIINFDFTHVSVGIFDESRTMESRELISRFTSNQWFDVKYYIKTQKELLDHIDHNDITMAVWIQWDFATRMRQGKSGKVSVILDATDSNTALLVSRYAGTVIADYSQDHCGSGSPAKAGSGPANSGRPWPWSPGPGSTPT